MSFSISLAWYIRHNQAFTLVVIPPVYIVKLEFFFLVIITRTSQSPFSYCLGNWKGKFYQEIAGETPNRVRCFQRAHYKETLQI